MCLSVEFITVGYLFHGMKVIKLGNSQISEDPNPEPDRYGYVWIRLRNPSEGRKE
jgi:hypothetical protein